MSVRRERIADHRREGTISATTAELASIIDSQHADGVDEAIWEEMVFAFRRSVIAEPLIAMVIIHAAAAGVALVVGRCDLAGDAARRLGLDIALILPLYTAVFAFKQAFVHRRRSLV